MTSAASAGSDSRTVRILCISADFTAAEAIAASVKAVLAAVEVEATELVPARDVPPADLLVMDGTTDPEPIIEKLLAFRARGIMTPAIIVSASRRLTPEETRRAGDPVVVDAIELAATLPNAIERAMRLDAAAAAAGHVAPLLDALRDSQRLLAAGRIAQRVKHDINNPLAAALGEAQLLELEPLAPEHLEAVRRIIEMCGRIVTLVQQLEGPRRISS